MSRLAWPCNYFFTLLLAHLRAATFAACVESLTDSYMLVQTLTSKARLSHSMALVLKTAMVWSRGSTWDHHRGIQWCWETHVLDTDKMLPSCIWGVPPLLPCPCWVLTPSKEMTQVPQHLHPCLLPETQQQLWMGCSHSLPGSWWCLIFVLGILTEAQDKDQLNKQQKWCCKLFPCLRIPRASTGVPWEGWMPCTRSAMGFWVRGFLEALSDTFFCHR